MTPPDSAYSPCPKSPPTPDPDLLGFEPFQPMVKWLTPAELARAGLKALLSSLFGAYADNRELQAIRSGIAPISYVDPAQLREREGIEGREEIWIDYVADLGDGFNSTYSIAYLLGQDALYLKGEAVFLEGQPEPTGEEAIVRLPRGKILVMGGDQVYPTATAEEYANRLVGPYRAARACVRPETAAPDLYAVPGNHDWYDGLTSFTRLFCQGRWIGGWRTRQRRSYFALELPHDWWLWGIDVQLGSDIDLPQLRFFRDLGQSIQGAGKQAKIILCVAEPEWVYTDLKKAPSAYDNLAFFEHEAIHAFGHEHVVGLAGDLHAYARYEASPAQRADGGARAATALSFPAPRLRFVSGGGGAYLYPTHRMPERLTLPTVPRGHPLRRNREKGSETFELARTGGADGAARATYPPQATSRRRAWLTLFQPAQNLYFAAFVGVFYLFLAWLVQSASKGGGHECSLLNTLAGECGVKTLPPPEGLRAFWAACTNLVDVLTHAPVALLTVGVLLLGLVAFADARETAARWTMGGVHTLAHIILLLLLTWAFARFNIGWAGLREDNWRQVALFTLEMVVIGGLAGGGLVRVYFLVTHLLFRAHSNEVFSSQSIPDYKHFLRMHVGTDGSLTIYPIGLDRVPRRWDYKGGASAEEPWFRPKGEEIVPTLIEPAPIRVPAFEASGHGRT